MTIFEITKKYSREIDIYELQLLVAKILQKSREFVLAYPETILDKKQVRAIERFIRRRLTGEPIAHITGRKEFFGLDFIVNKHTLVPRPETELMVELSVDLLRSTLRNKSCDYTIVDIGTGSGNIIISTIKAIEKIEIRNSNFEIFGIDISKDALRVARKNARAQGVDKKIKFLHGNLMSPIIQNSKFEIRNSEIIILANLPYLSSEIYRTAQKDVKEFEPKTALYSPAKGLSHYEKLLKQICVISKSYKLKAISCFLEFSPEQKPLLNSLVKNILPKAKVKFHKDLAGKWRICEIKMQNTCLAGRRAKIKTPTQRAK